MNKDGKKFISPYGWFSLVYPQNWYEFEDMEGTFLFYNPNKWSGNFRISAYKAAPKLPHAMNYGKETVKEELQKNKNASLVKVGKWECAYSQENFQENGAFYTTHLWITGVGNLVFECTFTLPEGGDKTPAEQIIAGLEARREGEKYPREVIPIRVLEIGMVNEAFEWVSSTVKKKLKKDFTGSKEDIPKLTQLIESGDYNPAQKDSWYSFGITFGVILVNEIDGLEWVTVVENNREFPALQFKQTDLLVYPQSLIRDTIKSGKKVDLQQEFEAIAEKIILLEETRAG